MVIEVVRLPLPSSCHSAAAKVLLARKTGVPFTVEEQLVLGVTLITTADGKQQRPLILYFHDESTAYRQVFALLL